MTGLAFVGGEYVRIAEAKIPLLDWGFLRSDACQDTVSVAGGWFFRLHDHIRRFRRSCALLRMDVPYADAEIETILAELVFRSGLRDAYVQMLMTRGVPEPGSRDPRTCRNRFVAFCIPYVWISPLDGAGLRLHVSPRRRISSASVPSDIKNYHWLDFELALFDAYERDCDSVVLVDDRGMVTEGPGFNIFAVAGGTLRTPARNVLAGITRQTMIELAGELGIGCELGDVSAANLAQADEIFATSTAGGVMPVCAVDGRPIGDGMVGPVTRELRDVYWQRRARGWYGTQVAARAPASASA